MRAALIRSSRRQTARLLRTRTSVGTAVKGSITDVRFKTKGCVASIACGSRLTEMMIGQTLERARSLDRDHLVSSLGGLSNETMHASHLAFDALAAALSQLK